MIATILAFVLDHPDRLGQFAGGLFVIALIGYSVAQWRPERVRWFR